MIQFFLVQMQVGVWTDDDDHGRGAAGGFGIGDVGEDKTEEGVNAR